MVSSSCSSPVIVRLLDTFGGLCCLVSTEGVNGVSAPFLGGTPSAWQGPGGVARGSLESLATAPFTPADGRERSRTIPKRWQMNVADSAGRWLLMHRPRREARVRLLCLPYAGGGASAFRHWPDALTSSIEVCPVQLPGRENRFVEAPFTRAEAVVEAMAPALRP